MIIDASKRFGTNAIKCRNMKANGVSLPNKVTNTKNKILFLNDKTNLANLQEAQGQEPNIRSNPDLKKDLTSSAEFKNEVKRIEAGGRTVPKYSCQQNGKVLRVSYGVICLRSLDIASYFYRGFFTFKDWQEPDFYKLITEIQQPLLKGLTELTYDYPDYGPIVDYLLKTNKSLIKFGVEPESYEQLTKRLLVALRKGVAEYWTSDMEQVWERVLGESHVFLQRRTAG